jgi:O-antigen/teichoic acid export membrane protein
MNRKIKINDKHFLDIIKGGGISFLFYSLNLITVYFIAVFISKYYGADAYGRYSIIKSLILVLIILSTLGLNTLTIKLSANKNHYNKGVFKSDYLKRSYIIILISSLFVSSVIFFLKNEIALIIFKDIELEKYLVVFPFLLIAAIFLNYNSNLFKGQGRVLLFAIISSFLNNFLLLCSIIVVYHFYSKDELFLIITFFISVLISFLVSLYYVFPLKYTKTISKISTKNLLSFGLPMMISSSMIYIVFSIDILMLGIFETSENVGIYRIVTQVASINTIFVIALGTVIGPKISKFYSENREDELKKIIVKSSKMVFYITLPILLGILMFSNKILMFFGTEYLKGYSSLILLSLCQFLFAISGFVDFIFNMTGRQKIFGKITTISALVNLVLNLILIPKYGIFGAAMSTGFSILLTNLIAIIYIKKHLKFLSIYLPFYTRRVKSS